jgi:hypothetical protein
MPRIDPSQLLTTLSVLLAPDGGIRSADDVSILLLIPSYSYLFTLFCHPVYQCCGSGMFFSDTNFSIPESSVKKIPDPGSASNYFSTFNPKIVSKLSELWSELFITDPDLDFSPIPDPGVKKAMEPGSGSATTLFTNRPLRVHYSPFNFGVLVLSFLFYSSPSPLFNLPFSSLSYFRFFHEVNRQLLKILIAFSSLFASRFVISAIISSTGHLSS